MAALIQEIDARSNTAATFSAAVTSGNAVIVSVMTLSSSISVSSVTDNQSNTYTAVSGGTGLTMSHAGVGANQARGHFFYCANITNAPTTVNVTLSGTPGDTSYIQIYEVSGLGSTITVDDIQNSGSATTSTSPSRAFTTTVSGFAVALIGVDFTPTFTPGSGWTTSASDAGAFNAMHRVIGSSGSYNADATLSASAPWNVAVLAIRDAASGTPSISSVSDATIEPGQTGVVITGTGFSSSGNTVRISPTDNVADGAAVTQTITAQSTTSITFTGVKGALNFETGAFLFVTNNVPQSNASGTSVQFVARPFVRENLISETGAAVASETGMTMVVYHAVPTTGSPNPAQVITGVASNGAGAIDVQLQRQALALNAPVWIALMKDGSPAKGTMRKVTPVYE